MLVDQCYRNVLIKLLNKIMDLRLGTSSNTGRMIRKTSIKTVEVFMFMLLKSLLAVFKEPFTPYST